MKQRLRAVSAVLSLVLVMLMSPLSVLAVEYQDIGGRPANPRADNPRSSSIFVYELEAGKSVEDAIEINNGTEQSHTIEVYAVDSLISSGGAFACEQKADQAEKVGAWIKLSKSEIVLGPKTSQKVDFTLTVPENTEVGEHNACIAIQDKDQKPADNINGIQLNFRSAIRVAVTVPGEIKKSLEITKLESFKAKDKSKQGVRVVLKNSGNVSLDAELKLTLNSGSKQVGDAISGTYALIAGNETELNFEFKRPSWPGFYKVKAEVTFNSDVTAFLGEDGQETTVTKTKTIFVSPTLVQLAVFLVVVVGGTAYLRRWWVYKRLRSRYSRRSQPYTVKLREDLQTIARRYNTDWKQLAKINKIKRPYVVHQGQIIYVPTTKAKKKYNLGGRRSVIRPKRRS